ncbi:MAG: choice-of-anchor tandem repeat GloVer-containing protein [Candidatus Sulfotelmatobacter sp.]
MPSTKDFVQRKRPLLLPVAGLIVVFGFLTIAAPVFAASNEKVLYGFCTLSNCADGQTPQSSLVFDAAGNLYGTTFDGGAYGLGSVFELERGPGDTWTEKVLYSFCSATNCVDGTNPEGLVFGAAGKLYGIAQTGGGHGFGAVFELASGEGGTWSYKVLHNFDFNDGDGYYPQTGLIVDAAGSLYGVTDWGGAYNSGTVYQLTAGADGKWTERKLHSFNDNGKDGYAPFGGLMFDAAGNLYGTTTRGGASGTGCGGQGCGIVFQLAPGANGEWAEKVLHSFNGSGTDGYDPWGGVVSDKAGNLYGTTNAGGASGVGTVFELALGVSGGWNGKVLHSFQNDGEDGYAPVAGLIVDTAGSLYGTTFYGGLYNDGTVFELTPGTNGEWTESVVHNFDWSLYIKDGTYPAASLIFDAKGNLYGTTENGGDYNFGAVFALAP